MAARRGRAAGLRGARAGRISPPRRRPTVALPELAARRHLLPPVFERLDPLSRTASRSPTAALLHNLAGHATAMQIGDGRPLRQLAAVVSRHGAGRLLPLADRQPGLGRLPQDRGFRPPPARLARPDQPQPGHHAQLFADLRLRHLRAPHLQPEPRRRPLRPVALADRRQRRRHDPPRRDAGLRQRLRRCRASRPAPSLPSYGLAEATLAVTVMPPGEGIRVELVEEERLSGRPRDLVAPRPLPRDRQLRQAGARHGTGNPRRERQARWPITTSARSGAAAPA